MKHRIIRAAAPSTGALPATHQRITRAADPASMVIDRDAMTVELSFSSEQPVEDWPGIVHILDHSAKANVRLGRLNAGGAFVDRHFGDQLGVVESAAVDPLTRKGRAKVRFSKNTPRALEVFRDMADGIRRNISVGADIHAAVLESDIDGVRTYRVTDWEPLEISTVPVPADATVGVGRSAAEPAPSVPVTAGGVIAAAPPAPPAPPQNPPAPATARATTHRTHPMNCKKCNREFALLNSDGHCPECAAAVARENASNAARLARESATAIVALGAQHNRPDLATSALQRGIDLPAFQAELLKDLAAQPTDPVARMLPPGHKQDERADEIGMDINDLRRFSLVRAINRLANGLPLDGIEREASNAVAKKLGRQPAGFFIPREVQRGRVQRATGMSVGTSADGGYSVETTLGDMVELLRNKMALAALGARMVDGLVGNVALPRQSAAGTAYWGAEAAQITASKQTLEQPTLTPHQVGALTWFTKQLLAQSSIDVEAWIRDDLTTVLAIAVDLAGLAGTGSGGQPQGIIGTSGVGSVTYGAAATWTKVCEQFGTAGAANALMGTLGWAISPATMAKWMAKSKDTGSGQYLYVPGADGNGTVAGYRCIPTNQLTASTHKTVFGNFADLIVASWAGVDVTVDPYTRAEYGEVKVVVLRYVDILPRHAASFVVSSDSGAQ